MNNFERGPSCQVRERPFDFYGGREDFFEKKKQQIVRTGLCNKKARTDHKKNKSQPAEAEKRTQPAEAEKRTQPAEAEKRTQPAEAEK